MITIIKMANFQKSKLIIGLLFIASSIMAQQSNFQLDDLGVFKKHGVDLMIYNDSYNEGGFFDEKVNGIEMIQHGVRTVTGGAVRLSPTPEQWDLTPTVKERIISVKDNSVLITLYYKDFDFTSKIKIEGKETGCLITVLLDKPIPKALEGRAGMNIEFLPATYFKKTFYMDSKSGICPLYPTGPMTLLPMKDKTPQWGNEHTAEVIGDVYQEPLPIASGKKLVLSPEDPKAMVTLTSLQGELKFYDGRNLAQNGWYVIRELIPAGKTGNVIQWIFTPNSIPDWTREPVISHSQVGYHPTQKKIAVIELDKNYKAQQKATLYRVSENGSLVKAFESDVKNWGPFMRYNYQQFDFSSVNNPGLYFIEYDGVKSETFPIANDVYENIWHATLDVWFPVQMDHMFVNEAYRVWHGNAHQDDALQAPTDTVIHDGYSQNGQTDSPYKPLEHIPGLNIGGWFDAGDFDIRTNSHCETVLYMVGAWEDYKLTRDETLIDKERKYVDIHRPDGIPDLQQQIEHGALALIAQHRAVGHAIRGIIEPNLHQYHHLGDAVNITDNLIYNPALKPFQSDGFTSGTFDDRWAFTNVAPPLDYLSAAALAAASRALKGYNDKLAEECLETAKNVWAKQDQNLDKVTSIFGEGAIEDKEFLKKWLAEEQARATVELLICTGDKKYADYLKEKLWPAIKDKVTNARHLGANLLPSMVKALPYMDQKFKDELKEKAVEFRKQADSLDLQNPYGIRTGRGGFSEGTSATVDWALCIGKLHQTFPDIIGSEYAIRGLNYVLGCHPASSISFVSGVGTNSKRVMYGNNRADFSFIAGGLVPGIYLIKPDFYENKEDWPFIWYENESVIDMNACYIYLSAMVNSIVAEKK
jgi:endoglucanase